MNPNTTTNTIINTDTINTSGRSAQHPLPVAGHAQDVSLGEEHVHRGDAQVVVGDTLVFYLNEYLIDLNKAKLKCSPW